MKKELWVAAFAVGLWMAGLPSVAGNSRAETGSSALMTQLSAQTEKVVTSPDGRTYLKVGLESGRPYYTVGYYTDGKDDRQEISVGYAYECRRFQSGHAVERGADRAA